MVEIQQADPRSRKLAILAVIVVLVGGGILVMVFEDWMNQVRGMSVEAAQESLTTAFSWSVGIGTIAITLTGCHFWWAGRRVRHVLRFPLPGSTVIRDTVVLEGQAAASRGIVLQIVGVTLILCAVGIAVMSWQVVRMLGAVHG